MRVGTRIAVVEDEDIVRTLLSAHLESAGYRVEQAATCAELFDLLDSKPVDLVILDLGLPDEDGLVALRQLRLRHDVPVLVFSTLDEAETRHAALELGADDYVAKTVMPREVVLRVEAILRRTKGNDDAMQSDDDKVIEFSGWQLSPQIRMLFDPEHREVKLTRSEFDILHTLVRSNGRVLSRDFLIDALAAQGEPPSDRMIDSFISRVRRKMGNTGHIVTVTGMGYRFVANP